MFPRDLDEQRKVMYEAQLRTNELLEKMIELLTPKVPEQTKTTVDKPVNKPTNTRNQRRKAQ